MLPHTSTSSISMSKGNMGREAPVHVCMLTCQHNGCVAPVLSDMLKSSIITRTYDKYYVAVSQTTILTMRVSFTLFSSSQCFVMNSHSLKKCISVFAESNKEKSTRLKSERKLFECHYDDLQERKLFLRQNHPYQYL